MTDELDNGSAFFMTEEKLGILLIESGMLSMEEVNQILETQNQTGEPFGLACRQQGFMTADRIKDLVAELKRARSVFSRVIGELEHAPHSGEENAGKETGTILPAKDSYPSYDVCFHCKFKRSAADDDTIYNAVALDISQAGMRLAVDIQLEKGEQLTVFLHPNEGLVKKVVAQVQDLVERENQYNATLKFIRT